MLGYCVLQGSAASDDTESKYSAQYEETLNPFSHFSKKERMSRYMNLKPYDKITLSMVCTLDLNCNLCKQLQFSGRGGE